MRIIVPFLFFSLVFHAIACNQSGTTEEEKPEKPWVGSWLMTGYDSASVVDSNIMQLMTLTEDNKIKYVTKTREGKVLLQSTGDYKINDQQSVLSILENGELKTEFFIRKIDQDSFIFQEGKFQIKWRRID